MLKRFWQDEDGATAIEYGLIAALVAIGAIAALGTLGESLETVFGTMSTAIDGATSGSGG